MITTYHNISFGTQTVPEQIPVVQGDTGREIVFILTDFTIPEGATSTYYQEKLSITAQLFPIIQSLLP